MKYLIILSLLFLAACGSENRRASLGGELSAESSRLRAGPTELSSPLMTSRNLFDSYSKESGGLVQNGRSVKFLIDYRSGEAASTINFINSNFSGRCKIAQGKDCSQYHFDFAREEFNIRNDIEAFNNQTYFTQNKSFAAGTLSRYSIEGKGELYAVQLYPQDSAKEESILSIVKAAKKAISIPSAKIVVVPTGNQQSVVEITAQLAALSIEVLTLDDILGASSFVPMHPGEAWGYLRLFPKDQEELNPSDIVIFDELPLDLTVVAGVITRSFQDSNSHINLKSKERNTPNMILRDAGLDNANLAPWINKPVHFTVTKSGWSIEATTDEVILNKTKNRLNKPWTKIKWSASKDLLSYDGMCANRASKCLALGTTFGSKAANLGFLKEIFKDKRVPDSKVLTYDPIPNGFGVPLQFYQDLLDLPANAQIKSKLDIFIAQEKTGLLSAKERSTLALEIRELILNAEVPAENLTKILGMMKKVDPAIVKWKIRSSANAEDIEKFDGAGLHDSYSSKTETKDNAEHSCRLILDDEVEPGELSKLKVKPKTVSCAIKGVYASLWNKRAIDERSFARIDHASVAMGLSILPSYDTESPVAANSVVVTRVINSPDILGYSLSIQKNNNTVTNPSPGTWSELTVAAIGGTNEKPTLSTIRFAKPLPNEDVLKMPVLDKETTLYMYSLTRKVEVAYCRAKPGYYRQNCDNVFFDNEKPKALDLEMKYLQNGEFVIKQVREFSGR